MRHHCPHWIHAAVTILLAVALAACNRSASNAMTPLPSAPPPTPTSISETQISPTLPSASATATATDSLSTALTATSSPTKSLQTATATATVTVTSTATKASIVTEATCGSALPSRLRLNSFAYVNPDPPLPNNLRNEAGKNNELVGEIPPGQAMKILDGPKCVDGWLWWKVSPLNSDLIGWTAEGDDQTYWLVPCSSEKECGT